MFFADTLKFSKFLWKIRPSVVPHMQVMRVAVSWLETR
jgi:hypothetical protein